MTCEPQVAKALAKWQIIDLAINLVFQSRVALRVGRTSPALALSSSGPLRGPPTKTARRQQGRMASPNYPSGSECVVLQRTFVPTPAWSSSPMPFKSNWEWPLCRSPASRPTACVSTASPQAPMVRCRRAFERGDVLYYC